MSRIRPICALLAALLVAAGTAGCGLGAGPGTGDVDLTVTHNFGSAPVRTVSQATLPGAETVLRMLTRFFAVTTRYGGGFVQSVNGVAGGSSRDWFYYVNGVQGALGAAATKVRHGDRIWWDYHDWQATESVPAVVGSFPEPFRHGIGGKRYPTTLECGSGVSATCRAVSAALARQGVAAATQLFGTGSGTDSLNVLVATWSTLRAALVSEVIGKGPSASGVYAKFTHGGHNLALLDPQGRVVRTLGAGAGLVAATADISGTPTWLITGTDTRGVAAAAALLTPARLHDHFAVAVAGSRVMPVPLEPSQ
jgi:hypothetical protein